MKRIRFTQQVGACVALALMAGVISSSVSANTISMNDYNGSGNFISCDPNCVGFIGDGPVLLSDSMADRYDMSGKKNGAAQLALLNDLLALINPSREPVSGVKKTDGDGNGFSTNRQYFSVKKSTGMWFFENLSNGTVTVDLGDETADYSNWTEFGAVVPVPAAVWLFGTALIGLFGYSRRNKAT